MKSLRKENGAITAFVLVAMLFFLFIAIGIFLTVSNRETAQTKETEQIKQTYQKDTNQIDDIYYSHYGEEYTKEGYVKNGLILHLDGINNTGNGHDSNTSTWKDLSGTGNHGILTNMTQDSLSGWTEKSLKFDGVNDYIEIPVNDSVRPDEFTIELIANRYEVLNNHRSILFVKWYGYTVELNNNKSVVFGVNGGGAYLPATTIMNLNQVYSIIGTYKDKQQQIYINGNLENQKTIGGDFSHTNDTNFTIGAYLGDSMSYFKGEVFAARMYNRKLSDSEIQQNYNIDKIRFGL